MMLVDFKKSKGSLGFFFEIICFFVMAFDLFGFCEMLFIYLFKRFMVSLDDGS